MNLSDLQQAYNGLSTTTEYAASNNSTGTNGYCYSTAYYPYQTCLHSCWHYADDNGKKAFEIIKTLMSQKLVKLDKVSDFVELMDSLLKIL